MVAQLCLLLDSNSFYAVCLHGSMDNTLLKNQYIESVIVPLYPNTHKTAVFVEEGQVIIIQDH